MEQIPLFATVPKGMESLLAGELRGLGARELKQTRAGVAFKGSLETAYRICLWSRLASRILLPVGSGRAADDDQLYSTVRSIRWEDHLGVDGTLAVDFNGTNDKIRDTRFGAVRVKDAIVDQFREKHGDRRPSVDVRSPDLRVSAHLARHTLTLSIDLSGDSLHRRGYRRDRVQVEAPLKENLAAALLIYGEWPREADTGGDFLDPMCGSATLPIEAAWMAADVAPGLLRTESLTGFGFLHWKRHDEAVWRPLVDEARRRREQGMRRMRAAQTGRIRGSDRDTQALAVAQACVDRAGLRGIVMLTHEDVAHAQAEAPHGLVATNPPYGERLTGSGDSEAIYRALGRSLSERFGGWQAVVLAARRAQIHATGLTIKRETTLYNGALPCAAAFYAVGDQARSGTLSPRAAARSSAAKRGERATEDEESPAPASVPGGQEVRTGRDGLLGGGAEQLANRLVKNRRRLSRQLRRENITCYRLYDADIPEFNIVVDVYGDWVHVQEYAAPGEIDPGKARRRLEDAVAVIGSVLQTPAERIVIKERRRQRGAEQYERHATRGGFLEVAEDELTYLVNLTDYLDTGLFIDQRLTRRLVRKLAGGRRFLNLFAYTGTMTVNALAGGSPLSASVDLSSTYLDWARRNLEANGFQPSSHQLIQADCLRWLAEAQGQYDLIWLDPPTFSNSKRMGSVTFDVQRDHADLIRMTARRLLAPGGILLFSTNRRGFKLHMDDLGDLAVKDMSRATLPFDCERAAARHHVYRLESSARE